MVDHDDTPDPDDLFVEVEWLPNEYCVACGMKVENYHYSCQGHQNCLPECPYCGGELKLIEEVS